VSVGGPVNIGCGLASCGIFQLRGRHLSWCKFALELPGVGVGHEKLRPVSKWLFVAAARGVGGPPGGWRSGVWISFLEIFGVKSAG
jgi:hypothetical protein